MDYRQTGNTQNIYDRLGGGSAYGQIPGQMPEVDAYGYGRSYVDQTGRMMQQPASAYGQMNQQSASAYGQANQQPASAYGQANQQPASAYGQMNQQSYVNSPAQNTAAIDYADTYAQNYVNPYTQMPGQNYVNSYAQMSGQISGEMTGQMPVQMPQLYTNQFGQIVDGYGNAYTDVASAMQAQAQMQERLQLRAQAGAAMQAQAETGYANSEGLAVIDTEPKKETAPERKKRTSTREHNKLGATGHISERALNTINDTGVTESVNLQEKQQKSILDQAAQIEKTIHVEEKQEEPVFVPKRPDIPVTVPKKKPKRTSWELSPDSEPPKNKQQAAWEKRKKRKIKTVVFVIAAVVILCAGGLVATAMFPYETVDLTNYFSIEYSGYNTKGNAAAVVNDAALDKLLSDLKDDYDNALIHLKSPNPEDYAQFRSSLVPNLSATSGLSNGSTITLTVSYDKELADKLNLDVESVKRAITVNELVRATVISNDQLFEDVDLAYEGISPAIKATVVNNSQHPFLSSVAYEIVEPKEAYKNGDEIEVIAIYDPEEAFKMQYVVDENASASKIYSVESDASYVTDAGEITSDMVNSVAEAGKAAFDDANEYGVRIYCEANLVPVYVNKKATFEWKSYKPISAYFKSVFPEKAGSLGNDYNDLDVIYEAVMTQSNGVTCKCYCAVRFSNFVKNADGSITYDSATPEIMSASYLSARVKKNVVDSYVNNYEVTKVL